MSAASVKRISKASGTIELEHDSDASVRIPINPADEWSLSQEYGSKKTTSRIRFGPEDFDSVLDKGIYVGRCHLELDPESLRRSQDIEKLRYIFKGAGKNGRVINLLYGVIFPDRYGSGSPPKNLEYLQRLCTGK